jgi:hypothetical protein
MQPERPVGIIPFAPICSLCPPLPHAGEGESCRAHCRAPPTPRSHRVGEGSGVRTKADVPLPGEFLPRVRGRLGGGQQLPHVENPLRGRLPGAGIRAAARGNAGFQWAPTLGGECYKTCKRWA